VAFLWGRSATTPFKAAVASVLGFSRQRVETYRWTAFGSHYGSEAFYWQPGITGAHEKGGAEGQIGPSCARIEAVLLPVFVSSWQMECCGTPFKLGEQAQWRLLFVDAGRSGSEPVEHHGELTAHAELFSWDLGEPGRTDIRLTAGAAILYWSAADAIAGMVTLTGGVHEDHHADVPEDFPITTGVVRRIRVETRDYREDPPGSRGWVYANSIATYRDVSVSPKWFADVPGEAGRTRAETGVLVELEVDD